MFFINVCIRMKVIYIYISIFGISDINDNALARTMGKAIEQKPSKTSIE